MSRSCRVRLACMAALSVIGVLAAAPAAAAPRPIRKSFDVLIPVPLRGYVSNGGPVLCGYGGPASLGSQHHESFTVPASGTLRVAVTGFVGDWDVVLFVGGERVAEGGPTRTPMRISNGSAVETLSYRFPERAAAVLVICNFAGSATGKGRYAFTPGR